MRCLIVPLVAWSIAVAECGAQRPSASGNASASDRAAVVGGQAPVSEQRAVTGPDSGRAVAGPDSGGEWRETLDFEGRDDAATAVAAQPDGRLLVAGGTYVQSDEQARWVLARYRRDGTLDQEFGDGGKVVTSYGGDAYGGLEFGAKEVLVQADGRILVVGDWGRPFTSEAEPYEEDAIAVARFLADGSPDASFGDAGRAVIRDVDARQGASDCLSASAAALQSDGRLVVAGTVGCGGEGGGMSATFVRLDSHGRLDRSFDGDGSRSFGFGHCAVGSAVAVQPDGRIVVGGMDGGCYEERSPFRVARLRPDGSLDRTFGRRGRSAVPFEAPMSSLQDLVIDRAGRIVLGGSTGVGSRGIRPALALARVRANGQLDSRFGKHGRRVTRSRIRLGRFFGEAVALATDGGILLTGESTSPSGGSRFLVARYRPSGRPDGSFGPRGMRRPRFGRGARGRDVTSDPDGAIVAVGSAKGVRTDFAVARLLP